MSATALTLDETLATLAKLQAAEARAIAAEMALSRQCDNMAFVLNHANLHNWHDKFSAELAEDRTPDLPAAREMVEKAAKWDQAISVKVALESKLTEALKAKVGMNGYDFEIAAVLLGSLLEAAFQAPDVVNGLVCSAVLKDGGEILVEARHRTGEPYVKMAEGWRRKAEEWEEIATALENDDLNELPLPERVASAVRGIYTLIETADTLRTRLAESEALMERLRDALDPFRRVYRISKPLVDAGRLNDGSLPHEFVPGGWPTLGDFRRAEEACALTPAAALAEYRDGVAPEVCICSAVKSADGRIMRGHRHHDCIRAMRDRGWSVSSKRELQGFITSSNRFVSRVEALALQKKAGILSAQGAYRNSELFSEDLY